MAHLVYFILLQCLKFSLCLLTMYKSNIGLTFDLKLAASLEGSFICLTLSAIGKSKLGTLFSIFRILIDLLLVLDTIKNIYLVCLMFRSSKIINLPLLEKNIATRSFTFFSSDALFPRLNVILSYKFNLLYIFSNNFYRNLKLCC